MGITRDSTGVDISSEANTVITIVKRVSNNWIFDVALTKLNMQKYVDRRAVIARGQQLREEQAAQGEADASADSLAQRVAADQAIAETAGSSAGQIAVQSLQVEQALEEEDAAARSARAQECSALLDWTVEHRSLRGQAS